MRAVGTHNAVAAGAGEAGEALLLSAVAVVVVATDEDWQGFAAAAAEDC